MGRRLRRAAFPLALLIGLAAAGSAQARPGDLDDRFGRGGIVRGGMDGVTELLIQPDGRMLVASTRQVRAHLPNGRLDRSFGADGVVEFRAEGLEGAPVLAQQSDGRILLGTTIGTNANRDIWLARLHADGSIDTSFAKGGSATFDLGASDDLGDVDVYPDGRIILTALGRVDPSHPPEFDKFSRLLSLLRLQEDGERDPEFGKGGLAEISAGPCLFSAGGSELVGDSIVSVTGAAFSSGNLGSPCAGGDLRITRVTDGGELDAGFAEAGIARFDLGYAEVARDVVRRGGGVLASGTCTRGDCAPQVLAVDPSGELDPSFAGDGRLVSGPVHQFKAGDSLFALSPPDRRFVGQAFGITRLNADGSQDASFGRGGSISHDLRRIDEFVVDADSDPAGRIVVVTSKGTLARLEAAAGPRDRDADRIVNARDRCPREYSRNRRGCPTVARTALIYTERGGRLSGKLESNFNGCEERQRIRLMRYDGKERTLAARLRTDRNGSWQLGRPVKGEFAVEIGRTFVPGLAYCTAARSYTAETWNR